ncbi:MAG TPA: ATP synthase F1 subunit epsilon [Melioribacteraceae bacterium]|nr:ATP synthase F1 subunit epsilon [Melioribacteraceae bacterium]
MKEIFLEVVTPSKSVFNGKVKSLTVPGTLGSFQVLYNHAPIISSFEIGVVSFTNIEGIEYKYCTSGGTVEILANKIILLAETFESKEEIDESRAKQAYERAKQRLSIENKEKIDTTRAEAALQRAINRLKFIK